MALDTTSLADWNPLRACVCKVVLIGPTSATSEARATYRHVAWLSAYKATHKIAAWDGLRISSYVEVAYLGTQFFWVKIRESQRSWSNIRRMLGLERIRWSIGICILHHGVSIVVRTCLIHLSFLLSTLINDVRRVVGLLGRILAML
jgi:hypothetical protein